MSFLGTLLPIWCCCYHEFLLPEDSLLLHIPNSCTSYPWCFQIKLNPTSASVKQMPQSDCVLNHYLTLMESLLWLFSKVVFQVVHIIPSLSADEDITLERLHNLPRLQSQWGKWDPRGQLQRYS